MSTSVSHVNLEPAWKQEVNRRVAAHKTRKTPLEGEHETAKEPQLVPASRAAQAAARVAARYAKAPSYSEVLAAEARAALLAAEAASKAALEAQVAAQAAAQSVLASLEAAAAAESEWEEQTLALEPFELPVEPVNLEDPKPLQPRANRPAAIHQEPQEALSGEIEVIEPAQPIYANLIEFPRPLIAARKVRPRLAEGPLAEAESGAQLSIFEVDPGTISTEPEAVSAAALDLSAAAWAEPEWSSIKLDAQPAEEFLPPAQLQVQAEAVPHSALERATMSRRLLAIAVDFALIAGTFAGAAYLVASRITTLPGKRAAEIGAMIVLMILGALYESLFLSYTTATPGMRYAQVRLCTFDDEIPTQAQRGARLVALLVSVLPMGLGLAWAIFDDDHLTWHDRLSRTYLRRY